MPSLAWAVNPVITTDKKKVDHLEQIEKYINFKPGEVSPALRFLLTFLLSSIPLNCFLFFIFYFYFYALGRLLVSLKMNSLLILIACGYMGILQAT